MPPMREKGGGFETGSQKKRIERWLTLTNKILATRKIKIKLT